MLGTLHDGLVELFRDDPTLVVRIVRRAYGAKLTTMPKRLVDRHASLNLDAKLLRRIDPRTIDLVLIVKHKAHPDGGAVIIIEVELGDRPIKRRRIAGYVGTLADREGLPIHIGAVALQDRVARKLATWSLGTALKIETFVIDRRSVRPLIDLETARKYPQEAVLSATIHGYHGNLEPVRTALAVVAELPNEQRQRYTATMMAALSKENYAICKKELPMHRQIELSRLERTRGMFLSGLEEGLEKGRKEGMTRLISTVLEVRGIPVSKRHATRIRRGTPEQLERWAERAPVVATAAELFTED